MPTAFLPRTLAVLLLLAPPAARAADLPVPSFVHAGQLTVCTDPTYAPMEFFEHPGDTNPVGFDMDLVRALAAKWNASLRILTMDFTGLLPGVEAKRCDAVISGTFITPERLQKFSAAPYLVSSMVMLAPSSQARLTSPDEMAGRTIAVEAGTMYQKRAEALAASLAQAGKPPVTVQPYPGGAQAVQQVATGRAAATLTQDIEAAYRETTQPGQFTVAYTYPEQDTFGIYFAKNDADVAATRQAVEALRADGTFLKLGNTWHIPPADIAAPLP